MTNQLTGRDRIAVARPLAARYRAGESIRDIAADIGRSYCYVRGLLVTAGVELRGRGGQDARRAATRRANARREQW